MDKNQQKILEMSLLSNIKGESDSPLNNYSDFKNIDDLETVFICLKYIEDHYYSEYKENKNRFILMLEELFPLNISQIVEWGDVSLREQKDVFQNTTLLIKEYTSLNSSIIMENIINRKKEKKAGLFLKMINKFKFSKESEDKNNIEDLKNNLSSLLLQVNQGIERLDNNYIKLRLIVLIAIDETGLIKNSSVIEAIENRRQLLFYALQNIEVSKTQLIQTKDMILKQLVTIDHIEKVTIPLLYRVNE